MNYSEMNLHLNKDVNTFSIYPDTNVNVLQYLPIEDKNDIIYITLQNSEENGLYNLLKVKMFFELYITYLYTDIEFTEEEKSDPITLYDTLASMGIISAIMSAMNPNELEYLMTTMKDTMDMKIKYKNTIASVVNGFIEELPKNAQAAKDIIEKFKPEDFQQVLNFAMAANGGRPIN